MKQPRAQLVTLKSALAIALAVHVFIVLGLGFLSFNKAASPTLDVTFSVKNNNTVKPKEAKHVASNDQQASGTSESGLEPTTTEQANRNGLKATETQKTAKKLQQLASTSSVITTTAKQHQKALEENKAEEQEGLDSGQDEINRQLAEMRALEARLAKEQQAYAQRPKIHRFTSVAAMAAVDAQYQLHFKEKIEAIGNANYPQSAVANKLKGDVQLKVSINKDGSLKAIDIVRSSGIKLLDQAAVSSVRLAAPFLAFPKELAQKADILEIFRTWQFRNNQVVTVGSS